MREIITYPEMSDEKVKALIEEELYEVYLEVSKFEYDSVKMTDELKQFYDFYANSITFNSVIKRNGDNVVLDIIVNNDCSCEEVFNIYDLIKLFKQSERDNIITIVGSRYFLGFDDLKITGGHSHFQADDNDEEEEYEDNPWAQRDNDIENIDLEDEQINRDYNEEHFREQGFYPVEYDD